MKCLIFHANEKTFRDRGYLKAFFLMYGKLVRAFFKMVVFSLFYNRKKQATYYARFSGLLNAMIGKKSWYRIKLFE